MIGDPQPDRVTAAAAGQGKGVTKIFPRLRRVLRDDLDTGERAALALEQLKTEFLFQQFELAADAGLRCVQLARGSRDVEAILVNCHEIAQLLKFHDARI